MGCYDQVSSSCNLDTGIAFRALVPRGWRAARSLTTTPRRDASRCLMAFEFTRDMVVVESDDPRGEHRNSLGDL